MAEQGGIIINNGIKGLIEQPVALVGTAEKVRVVLEGCDVLLRDRSAPLTPVVVVAVGPALPFAQLYTSVLLEFTASGGHSSMPPIDHTDVAAQIARFIAHATVNKPTGAHNVGQPWRLSLQARERFG